MDLAQFIPKDAMLIPTVAILVFGWLGFRWLRDQQRDGYKHESFRSAVTAIFVEAIQTDAYRDRMGKAVGDAVASSFAPVTTALREHMDKIERLQSRLGDLEKAVEGMRARMQAQRRSDIVLEKNEP